MTYYMSWRTGWCFTSDDGKHSFPANSFYLPPYIRHRKLS